MKNSIIVVLLVVTPVFVSSISGQWAKNVIDENIDRPASLIPGDIDGDGDADIAATIFGDANFVWYENDNMVWTKHIIDGNISGVGMFIADIDGDDRLDLTLAGWSNNIVKWYKNGGGSPITWTPYTIDNNLIGAEWVYVADIDCDDDPDVVATGDKSDKLVWYANEGGMPISWSKHTIDENLDGALVCHAVDIDGDDTLDIVANGSEDNDVVWYKNENAGQNWTKHVIDENLDSWGANIGDIDDDGDADVVAAGQNVNDVVWYENGGGAPVSWIKHTVDANLGGVFVCHAVDMDSNGTLDLVATGNSANDVVWYANDGGSPIDWNKSTIDANLTGAWAVHAIDINGDSFPDVVANQWITDGSIVWYENPFIPDGIEQLPGNKTIKIYPNPVNYRLSIETILAEPHTIEITSLKGQSLYNTKMEGSIHQIDLSSFQKGVYFITIKSVDFVATDKIIKL